MFTSIYKKQVIDFPKITLALIFVLLSISVFHAKNFNLDEESLFIDFEVRTIGLSFLVNTRKFTSVEIFKRLRSLFLRSTTLFFNESHASTKYDLKLGNFFIFNSVIKIPFSLFKSRKELKSSVCMDTTKNVSEKFCNTPPVNQYQNCMYQNLKF